MFSLVRKVVAAAAVSLFASTSAFAVCSGAAPIGCTNIGSPQLTDYLLAGQTATGITGRVTVGSIVNLVPVPATVPTASLLGGAAGSYVPLGLGANLAISGGNLLVQTGTSGATIPLLNGTNIWASPQTFSGSITAPSYIGTGSVMLPSSAGPEGNVTFPYNELMYTSDQFSSTTGPVSTLLIRNNFGGGSTNGGRNTVLITSQLVGSIGTYDQNYVGQQIIVKDAGNVTGATNLAPLGDFFGLGVNLQIAAGSYAYGATGSEYDYTEAAGAVVKYMEFMKFVDLSPAAVTATVNSAFLRFSSANQTMNMGLTFGDPQAAANGFPVNSTGTLIYSYAGSAGTGIDMSGDTFATAFIKGPNSFKVDNNADVHTNNLWPPNGASLDILAPNGSPYFVASGPASPNSYLQTIAAVSAAPILQAVGYQSMTFKTGGTAGAYTYIDTNNYPVFVLNMVASPANYLAVSGSVTTTPVLLTATGSDANIGINLVPKGTGQVTVNGVAVAAPLSATSASIGGGALLAGACASTATTVTGATVGMAVVSTPNTYPGAGNLWSSYVSGVNTVTTEICAVVAATPTASTYNLRVLQ